MIKIDVKGFVVFFCALNQSIYSLLCSPCLQLRPHSSLITTQMKNNFKCIRISARSCLLEELLLPSETGRVHGRLRVSEQVYRSAKICYG